jgi:LysR family glycine cleavage system transcriptional activator
MAKPLPPLNAIRAFEVASRHLNLSRAAEELGVTQGAISKQVIALEDFIGAQLFEREASGLQLTSEGFNLRESIRPAFTLLGDAFARYSRRAPRSNVCRISTITSFASQFLVPRLGAFREAHPNVELEFLTSPRLVDLGREEIDLAVRYGPGEWDGVMATKLCDGVFVPVCTPEQYRAANGDICQLMQTTQRLQNSTFNEWRLWADAEKIDLSKLQSSYMIEDFLVCVHAAVSGLGLALMPELLIRDHVRRGELVVFSKTRVETAYSFYICHTAAAARRPHVQEVMGWLMAEAADALPADAIGPAA